MLHLNGYFLRGQLSLIEFGSQEGYLFLGVFLCIAKIYLIAVSLVNKCRRSRDYNSWVCQFVLEGFLRRWKIAYNNRFLL